MYKPIRFGRCIDEAKAQLGSVETDPSGRYGRFREILGKGAMKTVYRAFDEVLAREVAWSQVKLHDVFSSPEKLQRLYCEVHLLKNLKHESIIRFYASWIDIDQRTFNFITEMFTSGTLREYRQKYQHVDIQAVKNWARQILRGIAYLHGHDPPVIHRDLKCDNIFVNGHLGQVKIGDLGLAAILRGSQHAHSVIGTPEFMAPELYEENYNELVDIYSFGMCVLEMLTGEYPYSECSNPAQIYKKVTSGKLPKAFYRIEDEEAQCFVGKCLEPVSKRLPAKELLLDPFLASDEGGLLPIPKVPSYHQLIPNGTKVDPGPKLLVDRDETKSTDMTITGTMNPEDDTIFLKVQILDKNGHTRNVYFPFDIVNDTVSDVSLEMVKELEITDWEPSEIAEMIEEQISSLVPNWKECGSSQLHHHHHHQHSFIYEDDDDEYEAHHPFYSNSSHSSSQASLPEFISSYKDNVNSSLNWLKQEDLLGRDDASSCCSFNSFKYSSMDCYSCNEEGDYELNFRAGKKKPLCTSRTAQNSTRFCPGAGAPLNTNHNNHRNSTENVNSWRACGSNNHNKKISRIRSLVDVRSQLLHRSLVEEIHRRRLFKTVGAVENIGFYEPSNRGSFGR